MLNNNYFFSLNSSSMYQEMFLYFQINDRNFLYFDLIREELRDRKDIESSINL